MVPAGGGLLATLVGFDLEPVMYVSPSRFEGMVNTTLTDERQSILDFV